MFAAPGYLIAAFVAALVTLGLHLITTLPRARGILPTARFLPESVARMPVLSHRVTDRRVLLLRVLALLALGAALARPQLAAQPDGHRRILLADVSRAVGSEADLRDSVEALLQPGDVLIAFDTAARIVSNADALTVSRAAGSLTVALLAAMRTATQLAVRADSVSLMLVSPLAVEEWDAATGDMRAQWPGRIELVPVAGAAGDTTSATVALDMGDDDPLRPVLAAVAPHVGAPAARVVRDSLSAADSAYAAAEGRVLLVWPRVGYRDTVAGVWAADDAVVVGSMRAGKLPNSGRIVLRAADGTPIAAEHTHGQGCIRFVALDVPDDTDLRFTAGMHALAMALLAPCGGSVDVTPLDTERRAVLAGSGGAASHASLVTDLASSRAPLWLLALVAGLLLAEHILRGRLRRTRTP